MQPFSPVELIGEANGSLVLTCEHASNHVPAPLEAHPSDLPWLQTHWGWDIGAADLTRALARRTGASAVLSTFSRLVCDPNRPTRSPTWIRRETEGHRIHFNRQLDASERERRECELHAPYHDAIDSLLAQNQSGTSDFLLLSVHSFTPVMMGQVRPMHAGVLFDDHPSLAVAFLNALRLEGLDTRLNQPYSGLQGLIYAVSRHGTRHGVRYLELEIRNNLIDTPEKAEKMADRVVSALSHISLTPAP